MTEDKSRAIQKFVAVYESSCAEFHDLNDWAAAKGHIPKPIAEKLETDRVAGRVLRGKCEKIECT